MGLILLLPICTKLKELLYETKRINIVTMTISEDFFSSYG